jgi:hypothetical protein
VVLDNADRKCNWLNDRLAVVATGGNVKRRDYFTTNTLVEFKVLAFVGITSRTPFSSGVTAKAANGGHFKTGQRKWPGTRLFYSATS